MKNNTEKYADKIKELDCEDPHFDRKFGEIYDLYFGQTSQCENINPTNNTSNFLSSNTFLNSSQTSRKFPDITSTHFRHFQNLFDPSSSTNFVDQTNQTNQTNRRRRKFKILKTEN